MPTRTITQELCDVCFAQEPPSEVEATDRIRFSWQGTPYLLLACDDHGSAIRTQLQSWAAIATPSSSRSASRTRAGGLADAGGDHTLFSTLSTEDKAKFRAWAELPVARRIADSRVQEWLEAGKPGPDPAPAPAAPLAET